MGSRPQEETLSVRNWATGFVEPYEKFDKKSVGVLLCPLVVEKEIDARQDKLVDRIVGEALSAFENENFTQQQKLETLSAIFTKTHQILKFGTVLLSESELISPPDITWKNRDKSRKFTPLAHAEEQFDNRISQGFKKRHLFHADRVLYFALAQWIKKYEIDAPAWFHSSKRARNQLIAAKLDRKY